MLRLMWLNSKRHFRMFKVLAVLPELILAILLLLSAGTVQSREIRFRIVANSDDPRDQALKLMVRDAVVPLVNAAAGGAKTPQEALEAVRSAEGRILAAARHTLDLHTSHSAAFPAVADHHSDDRSVRLETRYPDRVELILGRGRGHNWWCVMFPPMCLVEPVVRPGAARQTVVERAIDRAPAQPDGMPQAGSAKGGRLIVRFALLDWLRSH